MPATAQTHVQHTPPALSEADLATACWEDDGGPPLPERRAWPVEEWLRVAAALSERVPELAGRQDVIVTCERQTRSGAPAAFFPTTAELEIDTALFAPLKPATIHPARTGDEERYPVAWGALVHETAHAAHSVWRVPPELRGTARDTAAALLEESRAEHAHLQRRPADRRFLRACVHRLVMDDITADAPGDRWRAAYAAGLILARRDAGVLDPDETEPLERVVETILGPDLLASLTTIWQAVHTTADTDGRAMLEHARAWCDALGTKPDQPLPASSSQDNGRKGDVITAVGRVVNHVRANEASQAAAQAQVAAAHAAQVKAKAERAAAEKEAARTAQRVFAPGARPFTPPSQPRDRRSSTPITGTRQPTPAEKSAAGRLARELRSAAYRERTTTVTASATPPGRLNMRQALAWDAQLAAGATPTATPWNRIEHRPNPMPPLRVAIAVDVSGSMQAATDPVASAAWTLARAVALTDPDSRTATVAYKRSLTAVTTPGRSPMRVTEFAAAGGGHCLAEAIDALSAGVGLMHSGAARLLVIASDGYYAPDEAARAADRITTLTQAGCGVLWLAFAPEPRPLPRTTLLELTDPALAVSVIAKAAAAALSTTCA
ncbi:VWA domain-containing protein [Streptomyces monticola]|uniref:VWA domain-containing protein n=1 Tax=Streptomyces monticola TaxID=2666263 RepID=A0ABW2JMR8_9ACTN